MNKYQKAFNGLINRFLTLFEFLDDDVNNEDLNNIATLRELIRRTIPKKPIKRYYTDKSNKYSAKKRVDIRCPCCNSVFTNGVRNSVGVYASREKNFIKTVEEIKYCGFCGQSIDWSEEE